MAVSFIRRLMTHTYDSSFSGRKVEGMLRGFDPFMNLVIDDAIEYRKESFKPLLSRDLRPGDLRFLNTRWHV